MRKRYMQWVTILCVGIAVSPAGAAAKRPRYEVVGYVLGPRSGVLDPSTIAGGKMTRINYAFFGLKDGVIVERRESDGANLVALTGLRKENPSLQILVSIGGGGNGFAGFSDIEITVEGRKRFGDSAVAMVEKYSLDGIDRRLGVPGLYARDEDNGTTGGQGDVHPAAEGTTAAFQP